MNYQHTTRGTAHSRALLGPALLCVIFGVALCTLAARAQEPGGKPARSRTAHKKLTQPRLLLLFPIDGDSGTAPSLTDLVNDVVKGRLATSSDYDVGVYRSSLASIRRALKEGSVSVKGANAPFDSVSKVQTLMKLAGYDLAVNGSIDYSYDASHHQATVSLTLGMIDLAGGKVTARNFADSVTTPENSVKTSDDLDAVTQATRKLTETLMTRLLEPPPAPSKDGKTGSAN